MITELDTLWEQSDNLNYRNRGNVRKGGKTKVFDVMSRQKGIKLGEVRWWATWRQYVFFPINSLFDPKCLREVADYCEFKTRQHKERLLDKKRAVVV